MVGVLLLTRKNRTEPSINKRDLLLTHEDKNSNNEWKLLLTRKNRNLQSTSGTFCKPGK